MMEYCPVHGEKVRKEEQISRKNPDQSRFQVGESEG